MGTERASAATQWGARLVAACDGDRPRAEELAARYRGCVPLASADRLDWQSLDAVFVCTPPFARGPVEVAAIHAGVAVFLEKPIGLSAGHGEPILWALQSHPVPTAVGYMNRYRNSVEWVQRRLDGKSILGVSGHWVGGMYRVPWWSRRDQSGGQVNEQCTHLVDLFRYLVGEIEEVHALGRHSTDGSDVDTAASINLRFTNETVGNLLYGCLATRKQIGLRIFSPDEMIALEDWDMRLRLQPGPENEARDGDLRLPDDGPIFVKEVAAFLDAVAELGPSRIRSDLVDALRTQRVVDAIQSSLASGRLERVTGQ
jgi:predicted dehydrogenase